MTQLPPSAIQAVLFDLDGTLADTAKDLHIAITQTLADYKYPACSYRQLRQTVAYGANTIIERAFGITADHAQFEPIKERFFQHYEQCLGAATTCFEGIADILQYLDQHGIPWGIVTTKQSRFALPLLNKLGLTTRAQCIVTGDSLAHTKPHPEPLRHGCQLINSMPQQTLYVGDYIVDAQAANAAGMPCAIITNRYHQPHEDPNSWHANYVVKDAKALLEYVLFKYVVF